MIESRTVLLQVLRVVSIVNRNEKGTRVILDGQMDHFTETPFVEVLRSYCKAVDDGHDIFEA